MQCWGANHTGQLGDGTLLPRSAPVVIPSLIGGIAQVSTGAGYTCALTSSGGVRCWGTNLKGELGDDTRIDSETPVDVTGLASGVAQISSGPDHACALTTSGSVKCWGYNHNGQLGDGTTTLRDTPVVVIGLTGVVQVSAGNDFTCALTAAGGVKCWGNNLYGQLGNGAKTPLTNKTPVDVMGLASGVVQLATSNGNHACAITTAGAVKCWGSNGSGQLGDGTHTDRDTPVDVSGLASGVADVSASSFDTCAVTASGGVKCWGANTNGELGDGTTGTGSDSPVDVSTLRSGVAEVSVGTHYACAINRAARVRCWGYNGTGRLGDGTEIDRSLPVPTIGFTVTTTGLVLGHPTIKQGATETFIVTVDASGSKAVGAVNIYINNLYIASGSLKQGKVTVKAVINLPGYQGPYPVEAVYEGHVSLSSSVGIETVVISS